MDDKEFIETLKEKCNTCSYSQTKFAKELDISRKNLNEIENGKTRASRKSTKSKTARTVEKIASLRF